MILFKLIEIDLDEEIKRINYTSYNKRQKKSLLKLVDLFSKGEFQKCINHINDKKQFPYNDRRGYSEKEHIGIEIGDVLRDMKYSNYYTQENLLEQTKAKLEK